MPLWEILKSSDSLTHELWHSFFGLEQAIDLFLLEKDQNRKTTTFRIAPSSNSVHIWVNEWMNDHDIKDMLYTCYVAGIGQGLGLQGKSLVSAFGGLIVSWREEEET